MSESPTTPETEPDPRDARAARRLAMLERLAEIGMALATDLGRRVEEALERGEPLDGAAVALVGVGDLTPGVIPAEAKRRAGSQGQAHRFEDVAPRPRLGLAGRPG